MSKSFSAAVLVAAGLGGVHLGEFSAHCGPCTLDPYKYGEAAA